MTDQDAANTIELPPLTPIILRACSFQNWYTTFSQYTFQSTIITLDQAFIEYLRDNCHGLHLPEDLTPVSTCVLHFTTLCITQLVTASLSFFLVHLHFCFQVIRAS
ncbi:hypothetical protein Pst134EA_033556 [Puccinia striiformis f. sp. tritici]|uniref:uncharacterized protein n=1 Tax=Puccinia striiformis f. sp. tritici TaxID=168172 RepID=UPI002007DB3C|nr:uncharacterized protein Pst134EA_033556 [Puccinia striiformis f. sp. tritici]KAH9442675.1 hypothetical protein Pst134EA_033556 [Puccinia striiformis f. sp. tritici]